MAASEVAADNANAGDLPLLAFHRHNGDMLMLSVSSTHRFYKNPDRYALLRKPENLYLSTPQGWILIMEYPPGESSTAAYLWNPRTGDRLPLPNIHEEHDVQVQPHPQDPSHPGCVVVLLLLLFKDQGIMPHMCFCRISGGTPWRCLPYKIPSLLGVPRFITVIAACRGKLYFISSRESMGAIHFPSNQDEDPVFQFFDAPRINFVCPHGTSLGGWTWLVESPDNNLFLIYTWYDWDSRSKSNFLVAIHTYKMDFSTHAWHRVRDIGDVVVFLDRGYSRIATSCAASPLGLKGSHIYLFDHRKSDGDASSYYLCAFDLGLDTLEDIWAAPQSIIDALRGRQPFWIVPPTT